MLDAISQSLYLLRHDTLQTLACGQESSMYGSSWRRGIAESGSSQLSTLMIETPGDLVWDLPCVQQASCLEGGPLLWIWPLYLHVNQKSDDDDDDGLDPYFCFIGLMLCFTDFIFQSLYRFNTAMILCTLLTDGLHLCITTIHECIVSKICFIDLR